MKKGLETFCQSSLRCPETLFRGSISCTVQTFFFPPLQAMQEEMEERIREVQTRMDREMDEAAAAMRGEETQKLDAAQKEKEVRFETWWWL